MLKNLWSRFTSFCFKKSENRSKAHLENEKRERIYGYIFRTGATIAFVAICAVTIFGKSPEVASQRFDVPNNLNAAPDKMITLPSGSTITEAEMLKRQTLPEAGRSKRLPTYLGPQVILRNLDGKIPEGTLAKSRLLTGASNGRVKAVITENVTVRGDILLEVGTVLIGDGSSTETRLNIHFRKIVFRDGSLADTDAVAADLSDSITGLKGSKLSDQAGRLAASVGLNFVGGMSMGLTSGDFQNGQIPVSDRVKNSLLTGASTAALEQGRNMMNDVRSKQPIIEVPKETEFYVLFN